MSMLGSKDTPRITRTEMPRSVGESRMDGIEFDPMECADKMGTQVNILAEVGVAISEDHPGISTVIGDYTG